MSAQYARRLKALSIAPLGVLATAAGALGDEVDDRTLANLTLSPVPRSGIEVPKLLAVITIAGRSAPQSHDEMAYLTSLTERYCTKYSLWPSFNRAFQTFARRDSRA